MRSLQGGNNNNKKKATVALLVLLTTGSCVQRSGNPGPEILVSALPEQPVAERQPLLINDGDSNDGRGHAESDAQVLPSSGEERDGQLAQIAPAVDPVLPAAVEEIAHPAAASPPEVVLPNVAGAFPNTSPEALPEETLSADPTVPPATTVVKEPLEIAQADPPQADPPAEPTPGAPKEESAVPTGEFRSAPDREYTGRKISLDFKNADIHDVLRIIADVSSLNIVATDDVKARVTLRLVEVPWDQALDVILQANGLEKTQVGNVVSISTTRRLEAERTARLAAQSAEQRLAPLETAYVKVNYVKAADVVALISRETQQRTAGAGATARPGAAPAAPSRAAAQAPSAGRGGGTQVALMSPRGTIAADSTTNVVIIRDIHENIVAISELIKNVDVQTPQVVIESYLVTTNENLNRDLGIQWGYNRETGNPSAGFPGQGFRLGGSGLGSSLTGFGLPFIADFPANAFFPGPGSALDITLGSLSGSETLNLRLSALETQGKARVISRPRVVTLNNKVADIRSRRVVRVPITAGSLTVGGAGTAGGGNAFQEFDVGITLKVTPQISSDGFVLLDIEAESSELATASVSPSASTTAFPIVPDELLRTASSNVLIKAGDTFVLGGILQDNLNQTERGIPYLRDTPVIGWLFKGRANNRAKDELLVFITPKLVAGVATTGLPTAQQLWEKRPKEVAPSQTVQP